ncbi:uncharacterized protein E5676_scaffold519G00110 [Cucumis melo var. makuwa]|uniref:Retrotransposon gag domain-containing protein n=1 Tax=Cucumis melo var. makuwa TaxID=1194695 RepID=A0A5D3D9Z1_CUCMM|nr:uncharacterized protein E6C27_scaffold24G003560 [Cucumis melo var. makuwa]TYK20391.1 uncharacterized protein E5676_scaffold519G00110 [Cucumis melo var. makuwa]
MTLVLSGKNKVGFITNSIKKPSEGNLLSAWKCNSDVIASWIINSISKEIAASLVYHGSVKEVWDELKEIYRQSNGPHIYQLRRDLVTATQGSLSIEMYYAKITTIWQELVEYRPMNDKLLSKMIGRVELTNELYLLRIKNEKINHTTIMCKASTSTWHKRMGYPSISRIKELAKMIEISNSSITRNREFPMHKTTS